MSSVSVFIRARNEAAELGPTLEAVRGQDRAPDEIVVLDNESEDATRSVAADNGARVETVAREAFSYGRALNMAADLVRGEIVVFLSAHSPPADAHWLARLVGPIEQGRARVCFGRQVSAPGVNRLEEWVLCRTFPARPSRVRSWLGLQRVTFSNANAAVPVEVLRREPFREDLAFAEDVEWAGRLRAQAVPLLYCPDAAVCHSHPADPQAVERRMRNVGRALTQCGRGRLYANPLLCSCVRAVTMAVDLVYCVARGYWGTIPRIGAYRSAYFSGLRAGVCGE